MQHMLQEWRFPAGRQLEKQRIALLLGYDQEKDKDGVGQYSIRLYEHLQQLAPGQVDLILFNHKNMFDWLREYPRVIKPYDLIHIQYPVEHWGASVMPGVYPGFIRLTRRNAGKLLVTFHEWGAMHPLRKASVIPLARAADGAIFVSQQEQQAFHSSIRNKITGLIPIGVNVKVPRLDSRDIRHMRDRLLQQDGEPVDVLLGYFGFIYDWKQPYKMLEILEHLIRRGIRTRLVLAGDFPEDHIQQKRSFAVKVKEKNLEPYVSLLGYIEDEEELACILSACNVTLLLFRDGVSARRSSFWYLLELGVPIITAKPNLAEEFAGLIDLEQADVWLADADAPAEIIAEAVLRHREYRLPDQRRGISPNWSTIAEQHLQFYEQLIRQ